MTIAVCHLSQEGVVLGADSTTTIWVQSPPPLTTGSFHHFDFGQKIYEVGERGTVGLVTWGLGSLGSVSYRSLIAEFADDLTRTPAVQMTELAGRWNDFFWTRYAVANKAAVDRVRALKDLPTRTPQEESEYLNLCRNLTVGFCLGGICLPTRSPAAFEMTFSPLDEKPKPPEPLQVGSAKFWGCPNMMERLLYGTDEGILQSILGSGKWTGTADDLIATIRPHFLGLPLELPIREAVDWVHASIHATSKTMKFSHLAPVCGGPIEVAIITTDRPFRWVLHKKMDAAIANDGFTND